MTQIEQVMTALKQSILAGEYEAGARLMEIPIAEKLGVSRTPVRLALSLLEREGLVQTAGPKRGFTVRPVFADDVFAAILVRGTLEGMAARIAAERGLPADLRQRLAECLAKTENLTLRGVRGVQDQEHWVEANVEFHGVIYAASDNVKLMELIQHCNTMPLVAPAAINFANDPQSDVRRFERVFEDHTAIAEAVIQRQGMRAEMLMREHAERNVHNKRRYLDRIRTATDAEALPGARLVAADQRPVASAGRRSRRAK